MRKIKIPQEMYIAIYIKIDSELLKYFKTTYPKLKEDFDFWSTIDNASEIIKHYENAGTDDPLTIALREFFIIERLERL